MRFIMIITVVWGLGWTGSVRADLTGSLFNFTLHHDIPNFPHDFTGVHTYGTSQVLSDEFGFSATLDSTSFVSGWDNAIHIDLSGMLYEAFFVPFDATFSVTGLIEEPLATSIQVQMGSVDVGFGISSLTADSFQVQWNKDFVLTTGLPGPPAVDVVWNARDCDGNGVSDDLEIAQGVLFDCNGNGHPDVCDIANGFSLDCNLDGIPDSCQTDCNGNGIPDDCDIASGFAVDCNSNGILDSCELIQEVASLVPAGAPGNTFPSGVSASGGVALFGSPQDGVNGIDSGAVFVYRFDSALASWGEDAVLRPSDAVAGDVFGVSTAVEGNLAVIGAVFAGDLGVNAGAAYVFRYDPVNQVWNEETKLLASDGVAGDVFGIAVDLSMGRIIVGAEGVDDLGLSSGAAYVFRFDAGTASWVEEAKLKASDGAASDFFAHEVGLSGDVAVVSGVLDDDLGNNSGSAYVFRHDPISGIWNQERKLLASDGAAGDAYGISVDVDGDFVIVGSEGDDDQGSASGAAYIYQFDGTVWGGESKLTATNGDPADFYGHFVAIDANSALVGSPLDDDLGNNSGAAYFYGFDGTAWGNETKMTAAAGATNDWLGLTVGMGGGTIITGNAAPGGIQGNLFANRDADGNGILDVCETPPCVGDITPAGPPAGNGVVNIDDLVAVLNAFGLCP